ncbi:hypothetical protein ACHMXB_21450 (plasmid) [Arthrobacter sp. UC242_113]|uniref:hypothetical protein n=1 Tax=Arthrobacter sp. UC242_113 TaxID=3374550 RepID=UPI0037567485
MIAMNAGPPDLEGMGDRILALMPIFTVALLILLMLVWLVEKWLDARDFRKYLATAKLVRELTGGKLSEVEIYKRAFAIHSESKPPSE